MAEIPQAVSSLLKHQLCSIKQKSAFKHAQNEQNQIALRMCKI